MQSAQASEPGGDTILTTVPDFNPDLNPATKPFPHDASEPTVVREQNPPFPGPVHDHSQSFTTKYSLCLCGFHDFGLELQNVSKTYSPTR